MTVQEEEERSGVAVAGAPRRARRLRRARPGLVLSVVVLVLALAWAVAPGLFTGRSPIEGTTRERLQAPSAAHPFGTDQLGRDLFARVVHGAAPSLQAAVTAIVVALVAGVLLGMVAGFLGGWTDRVVMRVVEVTLSVPPLLLSLTVISALGFGTTNVAVAIAVTSVAAFARLMRAEVLRVRTAPFVEAALMCGVRWWRVLPRHVLPRAIGSVLALAALDFGLVVLAVASLSFLGYGQPPPAPEWGALVSDGRNYLARAWWLTTLPGLTVTAVVLSANRLSRVLAPDRRRA